MDWDWDVTSSQRFNPMDSGTHARVEIATLQIIDSLREFLTGETGVGRISNEDFANLLRIAAKSAEGC